MAEESRSEVVNALKALMVRTHEGDKGALSRLRDVFDEATALARKLMNTAAGAERGGPLRFEEDLLAREIIPRVLQQMRSELGGENPKPLERLLVDRVVATGLQVQCYETPYAQNARKMAMAQSGTTRSA